MTLDELYDQVSLHGNIRIQIFKEDDALYYLYEGEATDMTTYASTENEQYKNYKDYCNKEIRYMYSIITDDTPTMVIEVAG